MTPDSIIVSVPHCGTRFLQNRLGIKDHIHTLAEWDSLLRRVQGRKVYVPLRNPPDVWRSWCRRNLAHKFPYGQFFLAWGNLQHLASLYEIDIICIDHQSDSRITDWSKVGDGDASRAGWTMIQTDLRPLYRLPIVNDHYGPHVKWQPEQRQDVLTAVT